MNLNQNRVEHMSKMREKCHWEKHMVQLLANWIHFNVCDVVAKSNFALFIKIHMHEKTSNIPSCLFMNPFSLFHSFLISLL